MDHFERRTQWVLLLFRKGMEAWSFQGVEERGEQKEDMDTEKEM